MKLTLPRGIGNGNSPGATRRVAPATHRSDACADRAVAPIAPSAPVHGTRCARASVERAHAHQWIARRSVSGTGAGASVDHAGARQLFMRTRASGPRRGARADVTAVPGPCELRAAVFPPVEEAGRPSGREARDGGGRTRTAPPVDRRGGDGARIRPRGEGPLERARPTLRRPRPRWPGVPSASIRRLPTVKPGGPLPVQGRRSQFRGGATALRVAQGRPTGVSRPRSRPRPAPSAAAPGPRWR